MPNILKNLTPRLKMVADLVPHSDTVCDIGSDHGYVAIYLAKAGIAKKVIAADIKKGPLMQSQRNIALFEAEDKVETRLSDGFSAISKNEADCAVIAGMGGETIISILENEKGCRYFVLQMQSAHKALREYLLSHGYVIEKESICREGRKMYTAILAKRGQSEAFDEIELEIGPYLIKHRPSLFYDYVRYRLYEIDAILKCSASHPSAREKREHCLFLKSEYEKLLQDEE